MCKLWKEMHTQCARVYIPSCVDTRAFVPPLIPHTHSNPLPTHRSARASACWKPGRVRGCWPRCSRRRGQRRCVGRMIVRWLVTVRLCLDHTHQPPLFSFQHHPEPTHAHTHSSTGTRLRARARFGPSEPRNPLPPDQNLHQGRAEAQLERAT